MDKAIASSTDIGKMILEFTEYYDNQSEQRTIKLSKRMLDSVEKMYHICKNLNYFKNPCSEIKMDTEANYSQEYNLNQPFENQVTIE